VLVNSTTEFFLSLRYVSYEKGGFKKSQLVVVIYNSDSVINFRIIELRLNKRSAGGADGKVVVSRSRQLSCSSTLIALNSSARRASMIL
jgi:hypothetical protein